MLLFVSQKHRSKEDKTIAKELNPNSFAGAGSLGNVGFRIHHQNQGTNVIPALNREVAGHQHPFGIGRPHAEAVRGLLPRALFAFR